MNRDIKAERVSAMSLPAKYVSGKGTASVKAQRKVLVLYGPVLKQKPVL